MSTGSAQHYDVIADKQLLLTKVIMHFSPLNNPIQWTGLFVIGYGIYEQVMRLFYRDSSGVIRSRTHTRNFSMRNDASLLIPFHLANMTGHADLRHTFAHGGFTSEELADLVYVDLRNDLKKFKEALALVAAEINEES